MTLEELFAQTPVLPSMPEVARQLIESFDDEDVDLRTIVDQVRRDQALSGKVLRLANSAQFGAPRSISTLQDAAALLGVDHLRTLTISACLINAFPEMKGLNRMRFWRHSLMTGGYARWLGRTLGYGSEQSYVAGFMMRAGQLVVAHVVPEGVQAVENRVSIPGSRWALEREVIGFPHPDVTADLARRWQFPSTLVAAFRHATEPMEARPFSLLAAILSLSNHLADAGDLAMNREASVDGVDDRLLEHLRIERDWLASHRPEPADLTAALDAML